MTALEFLKTIPHLPMAFLGEKPVKASNSEIRRWLESGGVQINRKRPKPNEEIEFPVEQLIFFPKNPKRKCTMQDYV